MTNDPLKRRFILDFNRMDDAMTGGISVIDTWADEDNQVLAIFFKKEEATTYMNDRNAEEFMRAFEKTFQ